MRISEASSPKTPCDFSWSGRSSDGESAPSFLSVPLEYMSYHHPNNDYVELLAEAGIAGFVLIALAAGTLVFFSVPPLLSTKSAWSRIAGIQALFALGALGVMVNADAHTKLPAIAFLTLFQFAVLSQTTHSARPEVTRALAPAAKITLALALVCITAFLGKNILDDQKTVFLKTNEPGEIALLTEKTRIEPDNAAHWHRLARAYYGRSAGASSEKRAGDARLALDAIRKATELNPTHGFYWFIRGQLEYLYGKRPNGIESLRTAVKWAPANRRFLCFLISIYLTQRDRVVSPTQKNEYWKNAAALYKDMQGLRYPPSDAEMRNWIFYKKTDVLNELKIAAETNLQPKQK